MPFCQVSQIARIARIISRIRGAGWLHGIEKRFVMCGLICEPSPRMNRPFDSDWRSHARLASVIGLRENATAMPVPSSSVRRVLGRQHVGQERVVVRLRGPAAGEPGGFQLCGRLAGLVETLANPVDLMASTFTGATVRSQDRA